MYTGVREVPLELGLAPHERPAPGAAGLWLDIWDEHADLVIGWASADGRGVRWEYPDPYLLGLTDADLVLGVQEAGGDLSVSGRLPLPPGLRARVEAALNPDA
jgi:hypothetical protein